MTQTEKTVPQRVIVVGAGPVGLVAAASLAREGIPVTILEKSRDLPKDLRASTFHSPTMDMLEPFGVMPGLIEKGLVCQHWQFRDREEGVIATYDLGLLEGATNYPYRLQCEQWKLTEALRDILEASDSTELLYNLRATGVTQDDDGVTLTVQHDDGSVEEMKAAYVIACDGAHSALRKALDVPFEGMTIPEIFLSMSTTFDFGAAIPDLTPIAYLTDPQEWAVLLRTPSLWRVLLPTDPNMSEEQIKDPALMEKRLQALCPKEGPYDVVHATAYRVHQRVAKSYVAGRVFLAGDSAHLNNPLGGMGMNGGVHDAVNLVGKLAKIWRGESGLELMQLYDAQRRKACIDTVQSQSIRNRRMMAETDPEARKAYHAELREVVADPEKHRAFVMRSSMIQSLRDVEALEEA
ncbi:FAD-dependent oxidoreductase [Pseudooceanicola nanhaiensis]|uniref:FAD-dependent oxidoreductase n=1 Tax=Pseudooceanicola nanhaiensis TaxID=375761 RepID=UPI001CD80359|nr:FAD-dependent monooxygenase [Pseudooceanicola nanhaiensis]MCA0921632.1 FAD-dependent monooxygenase [Pseudooceanicola nanhaiensis]